MKYYNIHTDEIEHYENKNIYDLMEFYSYTEHCMESIIDDIKQKVLNGEILPQGAYPLLFYGMNYEDDSLEVIEFIKILMSSELSDDLPQFSGAISNAQILVNEYSRAMDYFFDSDLRDYIEDNVIYDPPETNCVYLWNFMQKAGMKDDEHQEWLNNKIKQWKYKASDEFTKIAEDYMRDESLIGMQPEDFLRILNRALFFNHGNTKALQLKIECLEQELDAQD